MRLSASSACLTSLVLIIACADPDPIYPPLPDYLLGGGGSGNQGTGATGTGDTGTGATGDTGTGATGATGASSNGTGGKGSSGNTGGKSNGGGNKGGSGNLPNTDPLFGHCDQPWSGDPLPPASPACELDNLEDGGILTGDITADRTLLRDHYYTLDGEVRVMAGKTLTVQPCVKIFGTKSDDVLVVMSSDDLAGQTPTCDYDSGTPVQAGKLVAAGEPMAPIIFTSSLPKGQRTPGDWGGVMILGNAQHNDAALHKRAATEGLVKAECYGWHTTQFDGESSGALEYVRIEYASKQVGDSAETNGLTLAGVGSGTSIHHVMVANSNDDCFEWFGGAVSAHHLIAYNCDDDMFDMDKGFSGHLQFLFGRQFPTTGETDSRGLEIDSGSAEGAARRATTASLSNVTLCGGGPTDLATSRNGIAYRASAKGALMNALVTGFGGGGLFVDQGVDPSVTYTSIFDVVNGVQSIVPPSRVGAEWFLDQTGNSAEDPGRFCDCWQPKPVAVAAERVPGVKPEGFDDPDADYEGAFEDPSADSNWMQGLWVDWSDN